MTKFLNAISCAAMLGAFSPSANAGGLAAPVMPPEVIVEETSATSHAWVVPLLALAVLVAITTSSSGGVAGVSDERLKTDVKQIGTTAHGLPLYQFRYQGLPEIHQGVMAQDVARVMPEAVLRLDNGILAVNYEMLGLKLRQVR